MGERYSLPRAEKVRILSSKSESLLIDPLGPRRLDLVRVGDGHAGRKDMDRLVEGGHHLVGRGKEIPLQ